MGRKRRRDPIEILALGIMFAPFLFVYEAGRKIVYAGAATTGALITAAAIMKRAAKRSPAPAPAPSDRPRDKKGRFKPPMTRPIAIKVIPANDVGQTRKRKRAAPMAPGIKTAPEPSMGM